MVAQHFGLLSFDSDISNCRPVADHFAGGSGMTHELDEQGEPIHVDVDPFIPTGTCAICAGVDQEELPPEERATE